jgi:predicted GTPase
MKRKVIIMGAAGRDFHNFNVFFRDNKDYEVVAFTATQIPNRRQEVSCRIWPESSIPRESRFIPNMKLWN